MSPVTKPVSEALVAEEPLPPRPPARVGPRLAEAVRTLAGRTVWHVNTTALGGGVAEVIRVTVAQHAAAGLTSRWLVTRGDPSFFTLTKQLHHLLHGAPGSGHEPTAADARHYAELTAAQAAEIAALAGPRDIIMLHDPQTLGLVPLLRQRGLPVLWRCHIGTREQTRWSGLAWDFLAPYTSAANCLVFSIAEFVPPSLAARDVEIIHPGIDPGHPRCRTLTAAESGAILRAIGLEAGDPGAAVPGLAGAAEVIQDAPLPAGQPVMVQISRWDPLKDMAGVMRAFADHVAPHTGAALVLAGPDPREVADDLENQSVLAWVLAARDALPAALRARVHLVIMRLTSRDQNLDIVNALQHRATVMTQKSLQEGYPLVTMEVMHKSRPLVASAVGGMLEQITDGTDGLLVPPRDYAAFGAAVRRLLDDPGLAARLTAAGAARCGREFHVDQENERYAGLFLRVAGS